MNAVIITARYSLLRMARNVPNLIASLGLPLLIIPLLGSVFVWIPAGSAFLKNAGSTMTFFAVGMVVMFQLFGGTYGMQAVTLTFLGPRRWRIHALPCRPLSIVLGIVAAGTLLSTVQGVLLAGFSSLFLGAGFGNGFVAVLVIMGVALLSQMMGLTILLAVRSPVGASVIAWIAAYGSAVIGGLIFPLPPGSAFFTFTQSWGSPFSLAQVALLDSARGAAAGPIALRIALLFGTAAAFAGLAALAGRRRLA
jgi:ABC-2 type transport system permease protein